VPPSVIALGNVMTFLKQTGGDLARRIVPVVLALGLFIRPAEAVNLDPVQWTLTAEPATVAPGTTTVLRLHALIDPEYHLYSLTTPKGGPIQTTVALAESAGIEITAVYQPQPRRLHDPTLGVMVEVFTGSVDFLVPVKVKDGLADGPRAIALEVRYQACSDKICLPPAKREADTGIVIRAGAPVYKFNVPPGYRRVGQPTPSVASLGMEPSLICTSFSLRWASDWRRC
jgi:thiol:disulfide interchange protein DsbD